MYRPPPDVEACRLREVERRVVVGAVGRAPGSSETGGGEGELSVTASRLREARSGESERSTSGGGEIIRPEPMSEGSREDDTDSFGEEGTQFLTGRDEENLF